MSRDASGLYTLPVGNPVSSGTTITSTWANTTLTDIGSALSDSLSRSGKGGMTAPLPAIDGAALTPSYSFGSELSLGFYRASAGVLGASGPLQLPGNAAQPLHAIPLQQFSGYQPTFRNFIVNGDFWSWFYGTSQTSNAYGSDSMWLNTHLGSTKTASQQAFPLGQTDVPGEPQFFSRTVVTSVVGAGNYVAKVQRVEGVRRMAGRTVRLSFWAKADAARPIAIDFQQRFGTFGSPSPDVSGIGAQKFNLTTAWQKFTATIAIPSIAGKTLGVQNDYTELRFWFDAGSNFNAFTASLGQQSGTFDLALVQVEPGTIDTSFEFVPPGVRDVQMARYCQNLSGSSLKGVVAGATSLNRIGGIIPIPMRSQPTVALVGFLSAYDGSTVGTITTLSSLYVSATQLEFDANAATGVFTPGRPLIILNDGAGWLRLSAEP